ncbi:MULTISPECIES: autotransporter outer membrane beta-barrel domain-containing protein [Pseudomonas]|uniref:autotransporter outer membrane beta-barrel domain-containing protein n=1 Tax=Pseudomonas TaxID=286 RepID=UPI00235E865C|nr:MULTISPECIES: autotransporter outer membrane beta-barrel domain-containing protein [Pseudomonas]WJV27066.1 autotransporter outer membrane beta-barrel domain-containing protein [Pseudomonas chlororaphis]
MAVSSALSLMAISMQSVSAADYEKIDLSSPEGESLTLNEVSIDYSGTDAAVRVSGEQNELQGTGYDILATGSSAVGVQAEGGGKVHLSNLNITTLGDEGSAIRMRGLNTRVDVKNGILEAQGEHAKGVENAGGVFSMDGGSIITRGIGGHALYASANSFNGGSTVSNVSRTLIETSGLGAVGVWAQMLGTKVTLADSRVVTHGDDAFGLMAVNGASVQLIDSEVLTAGTTSYGLAFNTASVLLQGSRVRTDGAGADGIYSFVSRGFDPGAVNTLEVIGSSIETQDGAGIKVEAGGLDAHLTDSTLIGRTGGEAGTALWITEIEYEGTVPVPAGEVKLDATRSRLSGDVRVDAGSLQLSLTDHSSLEGAIKSLDQDTQLTLDDSSNWTVRGDSVLTRMTNNGRVEFADPGLSGAFKQLRVKGDLSGDGHYVMNTDLGRLQGDRLLVDGQVTGNNDILVRNSGAEPDAEGQSLSLVQSSGGPGSFTLANRGGVVDAGTYRYKLKGDDQGNWSLVNFNSGPDPKPDPESDLKPDPESDLKPDPESDLKPDPEPGPDNLSTGASAAINSSAIASLRATWDAERATLVQRVGELRQSTGQQGLWIRGFGQQQSLDNGVGRDFSQRVQGTQLGIDTRIDTAGGELVVGALAGYSQADRNFKNEGSGQLDSYHLGGYATYLDDSGWYVDSLLTLNRWSTGLDLWGTDGAKVSGHFRSKGAGLSMEAGKQIDLDNHWFVEPQAQVSMLYARSDSYQLGNGLQVEPGAALSTQVRAGVRIGRNLQLDNGTRLQPYLKAGWIEDLSAQNKVRTNGIGSRPDGSGGGWYAGAGISGQLTRNHQLYVEAETSESSNIDRPWAANVGYRFNF